MNAGGEIQSAYKIISFSWFNKNTFVQVTCIVFILLFVYAAVSKILEYEKFYVQLSKSPLLTSSSGLLVWIVPLIEIVISVMLSNSRWRFLGICAAFFLMVVFSAYIIAITNFSSYIPCSCGGILEKMSWNQHLVFNSFFVLLGAIGVLVCDNNFQTKKHSI